MPLTSETPAYAAKRSERNTQPIYFIQAATPGAVGSAAEYLFQRRYSTFDVGDLTHWLPWLGTPTGNTQTVDLKRGTTTRGNFTFTLLDKGGEVTAQMADPALALVTRLVSGAFFISAIQVVGGSVTGYPAVGTLELISDDGTIRERIRYQSRAGQTFSGCTRGVDGTLPVDWLPGRAVHNGEQLRPGTRIQFFAGYAGFADFKSIGKFEILERTLRQDQVTWELACTDIQIQLDRDLFTTATEAAPITLQNHPITQALQLMMTTGTGVNNRPPGYVQYDLLPAVQDGGIGIDYGLIDIDSAEAIVLQTASTRFQFTITGSVNGFDFITKQLLFPMRVYLWINDRGQLSFRRLLTQFSPLDVVDTLTESDVIDWSPYTAGDREILNVVDIAWDYQALPVEKDGDTPSYDWLTRTITQAHLSITRYGRRQTNGTGQQLFWQGLRNSLGHQAFVDEYARDVFARWADPSPVIQVRTQYRKHQLQLGDIVSVTHTRMPNLANGLRGLNGELLQVIDVRPAFGAQGGMTLRLATVLRNKTGIAFAVQKVKVAGTTSFDKPLIAPPLFVATQSDKGVILQWSSVPGATGYQIRTGKSSWEGAEILVESIISTSFIVKNVPKETFRTYRIKAYRGDPSGLSPSLISPASPVKSTTTVTKAKFGPEAVTTVQPTNPGAFGWSKVGQKDHILTGGVGDSLSNLVYVPATTAMAMTRDGVTTFVDPEPARFESVVNINSAPEQPPGPFGWDQLDIGLVGLAASPAPTVILPDASVFIGTTELLDHAALTDIVLASDITAVTG